MTRGLLWLPLLFVFIGLAWAGWNEYQKLETYKTWAQQFDHAKYDIYAVLGQKGSELTWGKPTRQGPVDLQSFSLKEVKQIQIVVGDRVLNLSTVDPDALSQTKDRAALEFQLPTTTIRIPFTELALAVQWGNHLQQDWQTLKGE
ncbi:hypothetical protein H6G89_09545 [Oscillatoria sp. FACHB-1407]|uniref:hypothetical protein n=1 Tax=Oscillatoria sp. FACHB-1407 TaxID=2692847 RepID=UPI001689D2EC|nr:hypothetical protein [Oscillatoria sp. FACHB-1407]MBD2461289.1 hypothetical protein [Oscillatoria sp. FACHB-1407]